MDFIIIILIFIAAVLGVIIFFFVRHSFRRGGAGKSTDFLMLQQQIGQIAQAVDSKLSESNKNSQFQFSQSSKIIGDVMERLTKLDETNKQVLDFAGKLQDLQDILKNPKQRGVLGEYYLETLLKNVLPVGSYKMQYPLGIDDKTGKDLIVDAVVLIKDKIIPIDSKFSLENYNRIVEEKNIAEKEKLEKIFKADLKMRIDETAKYVKPSMGTMDFALMFIPHEAIYYDLLINQVGDLVQYAFKEKHVVIVSPTTFLAYLQTILQGLNSLKIEESTKEIIKRVAMLKRHVLSQADFMKKMGVHLGNTVGSYNSANGELGKIDKDVARLTSGEASIEIDDVERPTLDE